MGNIPLEGLGLQCGCKTNVCFRGNPEDRSGIPRRTRAHSTVQVRSQSALAKVPKHSDKFGDSDDEVEVHTYKGVGAGYKKPPSIGNMQPHRTDLIVLLAFILAIIWMLGVLLYAGGHGDPRRIYHGLDYTGQLCGVDDIVAQRPLVFWCTNPGRLSNETSAHGQPIFESSATLNLEHPVCVEFCPENVSTHHRCFPSSPDIEDVVDAAPGISIAKETNDIRLVQDYETYHVAGRYCFPRSPSLQRQLRLKFGGGQQILLFGFSQISAAWAALLASGVLAVFLGCMFLLRMEQFIVEVSWVLAVSLPALIGCILFYSVWKGDPEQQFFAKYSMTTAVRLPSFGNKFVDALVGLFLFSSGVCFGTAFWRCTSSIGAALSRCELAQVALFDMPSLLACPIVAVLTRLFVASLGGLGLAWLFTCGEVRDQQDAQHHGFSYLIFQYLSMATYLLVLWWILEVCKSIEQYVIGYAVQLWYFQGNESIAGPRRDLGSAWILRGLRAGLMWHLGSLALGALLVAITQPAQCFLSLLAADRNRGTSDKIANGHAKGDDNWPQCSRAEGGSACWEHLICFMHSNAYLVVAMDSIGFMAAAQKAQSVMETSDNRMSSSGSATWLLHAAAGTSVAGICTLFTWMLTGTLDVYADPTSPRLVSSREQVSILAGALAWTTMQCFTACMDMAASTVLFCYTIDKQGTAKSGKDGGDQQSHLKILLSLLDEEKVELVMAA